MDTRIASSSSNILLILMSTKYWKLKKVSNRSLIDRERHFKRHNPSHMKAELHYLDNTKLYVKECDTSDVTILATLNHSGRPVTFIWRTLNQHHDSLPNN